MRRLAVAGLSLAIRGSADPDWISRLDHGSFRGFPTFAEANALLDAWVQANPAILRKEKIGESYERRPIEAYVLTSAQAGTSAARRPQVLYTSLMHSREPASLTCVLYIMGHLLDLYAAQDPEAVYLVESRELWLVPFVNPDGYLENQRNPSNPSIRKNRRPTCDRRQNSGVDINRNFATAWRAGAFPPCDEEYQGTAPFSEPETQALKEMCDKQQFKAAMNFHSYGSMLTHPFNYADTVSKSRLPSEDDNLVYEELQKVFKFDKFGPAIQTVGYTAIGESDDWFYSAKGIISMSPEVGPESGNFFPPAHMIAGIDSRNFVRAAHLACKAGLELQASFRHVPAAGNGVQWGTLEVTLRNAGLSDSAGDLAVALGGFAGGVRDGLPAFASVTVTTEDGKGSPAQVFALDAVPAVAFEVRPLLRRSSVRVSLAFSGGWRDANREVRLCAMELGAGRSGGGGAPAGRAVCQCSRAVVLPGLGHTSAGGADSAGTEFVLASGGDGDYVRQLCASSVHPPQQTPTAEPGAALTTGSAASTAAAPTTGATQATTAAAAAAAETSTLPAWAHGAGPAVPAEVVAGSPSPSPVGADPEGGAPQPQGPTTVASDGMLQSTAPPPAASPVRLAALLVPIAAASCCTLGFLFWRASPSEVVSPVEDEETAPALVEKTYIRGIPVKIPPETVGAAAAS